MFDPAPHMAAIYGTLGEPVTPAAGDPFLALFSAADVDAFDGMAQAGDYQLRYPLDAAALTVGDVLTIRGRQYRVSDDPARLGDGREVAVRLREVAA